MLEYAEKVHLFTDVNNLRLIFICQKNVVLCIFYGFSSFFINILFCDVHSGKSVKFASEKYHWIDLLSILVDYEIIEKVRSYSEVTGSILFVFVPWMQLFACINRKRSSFHQYQFFSVNSRYLPNVLFVDYYVICQLRINDTLRSG